MIRRKPIQVTKIRFKKILRILLKSILIISGIYLISSSYGKIDLIKISTIYIHSDKEINTNDFKNLSKFNIFNVNIDKLKANISKNNPGIEQVYIQKLFPNALSVNIIDRIPVGIAVNGTLTEININPNASGSADIRYDFQKNDGGDFFIDVNGYLFNKSNQELPIMGTDLQNKTAGDRISEPTVLFMLQTLQKLKTTHEAASWIVNKNNKVVLKLSDGSLILLDSNSNIEEQLSSLQIITNRFRIEGRKFEYLDLRFQKPVVKFYDQN